MRPKKEKEKSPLLILVEQLEQILKIWENAPESWNIARGTTDPGYWVYNLGYLSS